MATKIKLMGPIQFSSYGWSWEGIRANNKRRNCLLWGEVREEEVGYIVTRAWGAHIPSGSEQGLGLGMPRGSPASTLRHSYLNTFLS